MHLLVPFIQLHVIKFYFWPESKFPLHHQIQILTCARVDELLLVDSDMDTWLCMDFKQFHAITAFKVGMMMGVLSLCDESLQAFSELDGFKHGLV